MADELPNLTLLIKLLKLTTSSSDAEALSAVRKANEQLLKFGGDWETLLRGKVTIIGDPFTGVEAPREATTSPRPAYQPPPPSPTPPSPPIHPSQKPAYQPPRYAASKRRQRCSLSQKAVDILNAI